MAENKKSFILYTDIIHTFENLEDAEAGVLIKHLLRYVNDLNPQAPDKLTQIAFEPIKQQLKRDLVKWDEIRGKRSEAGKASAESKKQRQQKSTSVESVEQTPTKSTVNDNVNVTVNVNDNVIDLIYNIEDLKNLLESGYENRERIIRARAWTDDEYDLALTDFLSQQEISTEFAGKAPKEIYSHFSNWCRAHMNKFRKKNKTELKPNSAQAMIDQTERVAKLLNQNK